MSDADRPADVREQAADVMAEAWNAAFRKKHGGFDRIIRDAHYDMAHSGLAALSVAGLQVMPADGDWEWCWQPDDDRPTSRTWTTGEAAVREEAGRYGNARLWKRRAAGPWLPVDPPSA